jgi:phosphoglycerate dehydrogenase-like enzyme
VLVNLLPLTPQTHELVGAMCCRAFQKGALYVSAGRGCDDDTGALLAALRAGRLRERCWTWSIPSRCPPTTR